MPKDGKHRFSEKEHRQAMHVKASEKRKGKSDEEAERIAWATVNSRRHGPGSLKGK